MAGIGFDLRRLCLDDQGLFTRCRVYTTAGMVAAGPWLITMASLWLARVLGPQAPAVADAFLAMVSLVFAASLVTVGGVQMAVTRWLADVLHVKRHGVLVPAFARLFVWTAVVQSVSCVVGCRWLGLATELLAPITVTYVAVSLSWVAMVWLSLVRQHGQILFVFTAGAVGFGAALLAFGAQADLRELLWAYALTNATMVAGMVVLILRGTEPADDAGFAGLPRLARTGTLWCVGTAYALSTWIDKVVFWWLDGVQVAGAVLHHPLYDSCFYLGYATVVPALAVNLVHLETAFYSRYRAYYAAVTGHASLAEIRRCGEAMRATLDRAAGSLLRVQGAVTALSCWFAPELVELVGLSPFAARTLRLVCIGALCHVLLLLVVLVLLYFDRQKAALRTVCLFLCGNALLACWSVAAGPMTYGLGYALAALAALVWGLFELRWTLGRLEYLTFAVR